MTGRCEVAGCQGPDGQPRWADPFICQPCSIRAARSITAWPLYFVRLSNALAKGSPAEGRHSPGFGATAPANLAVLAQRELLVVIARAVEAETRAAFAMPSRPRSGRPGPTVEASAKFMAGAWPRLLRVSEVVPIADRVLWLHASTRRTLGWDRLVHKLPAPCPACDLMALVRHDGDDKVQCRQCRATWTEDEYLRLVYVLAQEVRQA